MKIHLCVALLCTVSGCAKIVRSAGNLLASRQGEQRISYPRPAQREMTAAHPRLIVDDERIAKVKDLLASDPVPRAWAKKVRQRADVMLTAPPLRFGERPPVESSREVLLRVTHLAAMYRLSGEKKYVNRARGEMLSAAKFANWWPDESFLATSEMTTAMSIGYDWLHPALSDAERGAIAKAIVEKGLSPGLRAFEQPAFWVEADHNWNLVCNAGMLMGALAVYESDTRIARDILKRSGTSIENGLRSFSPDGGWEEGPTYWNYATRYLAFYAASLRSAYGDDFGLSKNRGLARTGEFRIHCIGPSGKNFNFADSQESPGDSPQMFGMAYVFDRPEYATFEIGRSNSDPGVFDLLWYNDVDGSAQPSRGIHAAGADRADSDPNVAALPTSALFRGVNVVTLRGSWTDPNTTYVAVKGGSNKAHHGHLDLGTFVLDALGKRWACDLGPDDYSLPDYNGAKRWSYYRCSTPGHNTLTIDRQNQSLNGSANVSRFFTSKNRSHAVIDLKEGYEDIAGAQRGVALLNGRDVLVQDEIKLKRRGEIEWAMHTEAKVTINGSVATLQQGDVVMWATILSPVDAEFVVELMTLKPPQAKLENVRKLMIKLNDAKSARIVVMFSPSRNVTLPPIELLNKWTK